MNKYKSYIRWLMPRIILDMTFDFKQWYLWPYKYDNPHTTAGIRFLCIGAHCRFPYYKDYLAFQEKWQGAYPTDKHENQR